MLLWFEMTSRVYVIMFCDDIQGMLLWFEMITRVYVIMVCDDIQGICNYGLECYLRYTLLWFGRTFQNVSL